MPSKTFPARVLAAGGAVLLLAACATPHTVSPVPPPQPPLGAPAPAPLAAAPAGIPAATPAPAPAPQPAAPVLETVLGYAERVRGLPAAELGQEVQRLGENGYTPLRATQLALALAQSRSAANAARAQAMLQRVQADASPEAQGLQLFARLLSAQIAEQRRTDEAAERQAQQLREAQRRIDQLNERLEALRAIERSLPGPDRRDPAPAPR